jgi:hypothetical protein
MVVWVGGIKIVTVFDLGADVVRTPDHLVRNDKTVIALFNFSI